MSAGLNSFPKGLIIAAPKSGSGKTLVTLSLLRALKNEGVNVASAKIGPDYIDPAFHTKASGANCLNIDPWAMRLETQNSIIQSLSSQNPDVIITEGVMGLFDGAKDGNGSTADFAADSGWPVVLIVDVKGQTASAAAIVKGFTSLRDDIHISAVIFNNVGSKNHSDLIQKAMDEFLPDVSILGFLPRVTELNLPDRHLGLIQAQEHSDFEAFLRKSSDWVSSHCDLKALVDLSTSFRNDNEKNNGAFIDPIGQRISIAKDVAFAFSYQALLSHWRSCGAELSFFSPLLDEAPDESSDAVYLPGGYPELHASKLSSNVHFLDGLRTVAGRNAFVFGECGGYMILGESIVDAEGIAHKMAGLLPVSTNFQKRKLHLGYRKVKLLEDCKLGIKDTEFRGHEFHYASTDTIDAHAPSLFQIHDAIDNPLGNAGLMVKNVAGSFIHLIDKYL